MQRLDQMWPGEADVNYIFLPKDIVRSLQHEVKKELYTCILLSKSVNILYKGSDPILLYINNTVGDTSIKK